MFVFFFFRPVHLGAVPDHRHEAPQRRLRRRAVQPPDGSQWYRAASGAGTYAVRKTPKQSSSLTFVHVLLFRV